MPFCSLALSRKAHEYVCVYVCVCMCVRVCVCARVFMRLYITAQFGPVILVILCPSHWSSQGGSLILFSKIPHQTRQRICVRVCLYAYVCARACVRIYLIAQIHAIRPFDSCHYMPLALILPKRDHWYLLRKPLIRREKGEKLSLFLYSSSLSPEYFALPSPIPCYSLEYLGRQLLNQ